MPAITKFIIVLDSAAPCYALSFDVSPCDIFRNTAATRAVATPDRTKAHQFDTFEEAREVSKDITGWGGAQRVEPIEVEVKGPSLNDPATRIEARDIATSAFCDAIDNPESDRCAEGSSRLPVPIDAAVKALRAEGYRVGVDIRLGAASFADLHLTDPFGVYLTLNWEPCVEGFDYPTSGDDACDLAEEKAQHEDEPICAGCDGLFPLREGQDECETCAAARSIVNPVTAALVAATEELSNMADADGRAWPPPVMPILDEDAVTDLLTNLRHAAAADGIDFDELVAISARHFVAEVKVRADIARKRAEQANG